jgi:uncharacterized protein YceK
MKKRYSTKFLALLLLLAVLVVSGCAATQQSTTPAQRGYHDAQDPEGRPLWFRISPPGY